MQIDPIGLSPNQVSLSHSVHALTCQLPLSPALFTAFCLAGIDYIAIMVMEPMESFFLRECPDKLSNVSELECLYVTVIH